MNKFNERFLWHALEKMSDATMIIFSIFLAAMITVDGPAKYHPIYAAFFAIICIAMIFMGAFAKALARMWQDRFPISGTEK